MRLIEWRMKDDRNVRVEFKETGAGVLVNQTFDAEPAPSVDEQRQDWQSILDGFARHVTTRAGRRRAYADLVASTW